MELFNVYVQDVISQALDPSFLLAIQEQQGLASSLNVLVIFVAEL